MWDEVVNGLHQARTAGLAGQDPAWDVQLALLDYLEGHWQQPDDSLSQMRGQRRDSVHSKVHA